MYIVKFFGVLGKKRSQHIGYQIAIPNKSLSSDATWTLINLGAFRNKRSMTELFSCTKLSSRVAAAFIAKTRIARPSS